MYSSLYSHGVKLWITGIVSVDARAQPVHKWKILLF